MRAKKKKGSKNAIVKDVMAKGVTARKAEKAVNAVFYLMTRALWRGENVEIPGGTVSTRRRKGKPRTKFQTFRNVRTRQLMSKLARYPGSRIVVKFTPDLNLDVTPFPVPEPPEQIEARQLASELLRGKPVNDFTMNLLRQAVEIHPHQPWALLRRLRELKARGQRYDDPYSLAGGVSFLYWI